MKTYQTKEELMYALNNYPVYEFENAPAELKDDKEIVLLVVKRCGYNLKYASNRLKNDVDVVKIAIEKDPTSIQYASENIKNNKQIALLAVQAFGNCLQFVSQELKKDKEFVTKAIIANPESFVYADESLRQDKEFARFAVGKWSGNLRYMSSNLLDDKDFILSLNNDVKLYGLRFLSEKLRSDKDIVTAFVKNCGSDLQYASENMKDDIEVVLCAAQNDVKAISCASNRIRSLCNKLDREIVSFRQGYKHFEDLSNEIFRYDYFLTKLKNAIATRVSNKYMDRELSEDLFAKIDKKVEEISAEIVEKIKLNENSLDADGGING